MKLTARTGPCMDPGNSLLIHCGCDLISWRNTCLLALFKENEHEVPKTDGLVFNCGSCA